MHSYRKRILKLMAKKYKVWCEMLNVFVLCAETIPVLFGRKWSTLPHVIKDKQNLQTLHFAARYIFSAFYNI